MFLFVLVLLCVIVFVVFFVLLWFLLLCFGFVLVLMCFVKFLPEIGSECGGSIVHKSPIIVVI